jgi:hypothetical protein
MVASRKLLIIGDSFVAEDVPNFLPQNYQWAWWRRLAEDVKCEPINLAITGASNLNIWHQLKHGYQYHNPHNILVVLTAPNRIENINVPIEGDIQYEHFKRGDITSWAVHDRLAQGEILPDHLKYFDYELAVDRDKIIANSILSDAVRRPCVILPNLFERFTRYHFNIVREAKPRDWCDVESGILDEPELGHMYESWHERFYTEHKEMLLAKLE